MAPDSSEPGAGAGRAGAASAGAGSATGGSAAAGSAAAGRVIVADDPAAGRYVISLDDEPVGLLAYRLADGVMAMTHAEIDPAHGGQGLATALTREALADARARGLRVRPLCPFVVDYLARHPGEYDDLAA